MKSNPWKGLVSYEETDLEKYQFCGRTKSIGKYYSLITNNLISTLYGRTGCGKTSMLQAGIFPLLRHESYFPVMCRLSLRNEKETFADYLINRIEQEIKSLGFSQTQSKIQVNQVEEVEKYKLWKYFYGNVFYGTEGNVIFPVIVLDQFEEVLINAKEESLRFLEQISFLVGDDLLLPDDCYSNFRVTISLREDFLYLLEDTIDEGKLQGLRDNRMRLTPLTFDEADEVISLGNDFILESDREKIVKSICSLAGNRRGNISTNMLSLICSQMYQLYVEKQGSSKLTHNDLKKLSEDPLRNFYKKSIKGLKDSTVSFIENKLVLNGFRRPVTIHEFESNVPIADRNKLTIGETKLLQFITANDNECVELIHDTLSRTVFRVSKEKRKKSKAQLYGIFLEILYCIFTAIAIVFDVNINNFSPLISIFGVGLLSINWLYSIATLGSKTFSRIHLFLLWIINNLVFFVALGADLLENVSIPIYLLAVYQFFIPIVNLIRQNYSETRLSFVESFKYVYSVETIIENYSQMKGVLRASYVVLILGSGFLSGFFMSSWALWCLLPVCSCICLYLLNQYFDLNKEARGVSTYLFPFIYSILFVSIQHIASNHILLTKSLFWLFLIWSIWSLNRNKGEIKSKIRRFVYIFSVFGVCGFFMPVLFLGYNPIGFGNVGRNWTQPNVNSSIYIPLLSFHNIDGLNGVADRHQKIFDAWFMSIKDIDYKFFDWDDLKSSYVDYMLLSQYLGKKEINEKDIILCTTTGTFHWNEKFSERGNSLYLSKRISDLESTPCDSWTEEEFKNLSELASSYRIVGKDTLASSLEVQYFLRRMIQAEIYQSVDSVFVPNSEICCNYIDYYIHKKKDDSYEGDYTELFRSKADSNECLKQRIFQYISPFEDFSVANYMSTLALYPEESLLSLLNSYRYVPIPIKWVQNQLGESSDMLYQTRNTWGRYVVDSVFVDTYEHAYFNNLSYNNSSAWQNLFLLRFDRAESYARKSIDCMMGPDEPENITSYITYTNYITSLFMQGKTAESIALINLMKDYSIAESDIDQYQVLFPVQADEFKVSVGEGICQDFNHFVRTGVLQDTTTLEFRDLRKILSLEFSLISDQGHSTYANGWNLSLIPDSLFLFYKDESHRLPLIKNIDVNLSDSIAICKMEAGGYRYLNLSKMEFFGDIYDYAWHYNEGLAAVEINGRIGFIDELGNYVISPQYKPESWLQKDHYRLAFINGKAAVPDDNLNYNLIDIDGDWQWSGFSFPFVKLNEHGMIVKQSMSFDYWVCTNRDGIIDYQFDKEISDIIYASSKDNCVPIYNHFDIRKKRHASDIPDIDISGIWYCNQDRTFVYFGNHNSNYQKICNSTSIENGKYYLSENEDSLLLVAVLDSPTLYVISLVDNDVIQINDKYYSKIKNL